MDGTPHSGSFRRNHPMALRCAEWAPSTASISTLAAEATRPFMSAMPPIATKQVSGSETPLRANLGQHTICAILQWLFADGGLPVYRLFVSGHLGHCDLLACFNQTRTDLIEVISQHKIEIGVTHRSGHRCPFDIS